MNMKSRAGSGSVAAFLAILLVTSVALNAAFLAGCIFPEDLRGGSKESLLTSQQRSSSNVSEVTYLREIATKMGLSLSLDKTPGDIAFDIKQVLDNAQSYRGDVFTEKAFEECKAAIPTTKDTETFKAYQDFIKKVARKKIIILKK